MHNAFGRVLPLQSNFPLGITDVILEARHLDRMGFAVPHSAVTIALQENTYNGYVMDLDEMIAAYNETLSSLSPVEIRMLKTHIQRMDGVLKPGLTTLNWNSQRIPAFVSSGRHAVERFRSCVSGVRKHSSAVEEVVEGIEGATLIDGDELRRDAGGVSMTVSDFTDLLESKAEERIGQLVQRYRSIKPILVKVEMAVTETDGGTSPLLSEFYSYWECRVHNALVRMVIRSLLSFIVLIRSSDPLCHVSCALSGKDVVVAPPIADIFKHVNRCIRLVIESPKKFVRWMNGTCIEAPPQPQGDGERKYVHSFYADVTKNDAVVGAFLKFNQEARGVITEVNEYIKRWGKSGSEHNLWDPKRKANMERYLESDPPTSFFAGELSHLEELVGAYEASLVGEDPLIGMAAKRSIRLFQVDCSEVATGMCQQVREWKGDVGIVFHSVAKRRLETFNAKADKLGKDLAIDPETLSELKTVLGCVADIISASMDMELACMDLRERYDTLKTHSVLVPPEETTAALATGSMWHNLVVTARTKDLRLADVKAEFAEVTREQAKAFESKSKEVKTVFLDAGPGCPHVGPDEGAALFNEWRGRLAELNGERDAISEQEEMFDLSSSDFPLLSDVEREMVELKSIYGVYSDFKEFEQSQSTCLWVNVETTSMEEAIEALEVRIRKVRATDNESAHRSVHEAICSFKESLPLIAALKNCAMQPRHWDKLAAVAETQMKPHTGMMTLADIFAMDLSKHPEEVGEVINEAAQEGKIASAVEEVSSFWAKAELASQEYTKDGSGGIGSKMFVLKSVDDLLLTLEDHLLNLQTMSASRFIGIFRDDVKSWQVKLTTVADCLNVWFLDQRKWMYLESIYGLEDIRRQLPEEAKAFEEASGTFVTIMTETREDPCVIAACCGEGEGGGDRLGILEDLSKSLDVCQKRLSDYLNTKRNSFARFYFISDDELISVLGSSDPRNVQPHLLKLFDNVKRLGFGRGNMRVVGLESSEGESFELRSAVSIEGPVECWMTKVEEEMKQSLWTLTKQAVFRYATERRTDWIADAKCLGMNTICGSQVWWTWEVEDAFCRVADGEKQALRNLEAKLNRQLSDMVQMVRSPLDRIVRKKVTTLLVIDVHARDIVSSFVRESVLSAKDFEWESQLRFYWDRGEDDCVVRQCTGKFYYGFEYMGLNGRLVITPLTDRCYMTLTQALTFKLGGSPAGPAGTGKTETVKDLAKSLALPCFVINCGEGLDYKAMGSIFSGLVQVGAWGCFDEFNRINIEVLSVVSAQLKAIQNALISGALTVDIGTGGDEVHIKRVKGFATSGAFITMNPGYAGRTELPDNLKALFRPVTMVVPDLAKIAENMLFSEGFDDSKSLSKKMVVLYKLSKEQLSKQFHYDFGLRSMKTVLVMAGELKRQFSDIPEDLVLMRILRDANLPKFVFEDVPLFLGLINDLFPGMDCPRVGYESLRNEIKRNLSEYGYECSDGKVVDWQADKALQLFETQQVRHTTMLVGPTGGSKSLILRALTSARLEADGVVVKRFVINPKAQPLDELYGIMDPTTRDWTDGILSKNFREANQPLPTGKENEIRWIVFDGDVDALWVENMNSVMDDNRLLTLPNGERIRLQPHCALLCEVFDLQYASPATISRCGMVWVDPKDLGFTPYYERWLKQRFGTDFVVAAENQSFVAFLMRLFDKYVPPSIDYVLKGLVCGVMGEKLTQVVPQGDMELCKQLCILLDSFLPTSTWETTSERDIECLFIYCLIWSVGALLDQDCRRKFSEFLKGISSDIIPEDTLHEYYYSLEEHKWMKWETRVPEYAEPKPFFFHHVVVPTSLSVLHGDMLERLAPSRPILFVGESGNGKTLAVENYTSSLPADKYASTVLVNMSSRTSARDVQQNIEANVEKRLGSTYGPAAGKHLFVFIDDMNMPKVDAYGTQQPIAFLLTLLDHGFIYSREKEIQQRHIKDLNFIAAMGPPSGARNPTDPRFLSRFSCFHMTNPDQEVLSSIYSKIIGSRMAHFSDSVKEAASKVTSATLSLFSFIVAKLPPTPSKFHYIFTLRDLSRVFEGLCSATPDRIQNGEQIVRLWRNEAQRVFLDRLVSPEDAALAEGKLGDIINTTFSSSSKYALQNPVVFGDFEQAAARIAEGFDDPRTYTDLGDLSTVRKIFDQVMESYNACASHRPLTLVLFEMALDHLVRITRIIRNKRGHALLIGVGGSGKQSLAKLAAYTCGYDTFEITLCRGYCETNFCEDLKELYKKLCEGPVVFLFSDAHVLEEGFLEYVSNMLSMGIPPTLFDKDEKDAMCGKVRDQAHAAGMDEWAYTVDACRNNLHVVLAMSPSGDCLRMRCRNFPALVSSCAIDVFFAWPNEALEKVARALLKDEEIIPDALQDPIAKHMVWTHQTITDKAAQFRTVLKRPYFVTPKSYIDYITVFREKLQSNAKKIDSGVKRLEGGLLKLEDAAKAVDRMQIELRDKKKLVDAKTKDVKALIETIKTKTEVATKQNEEAQKKQAAAELQAKTIMEEKGKADTALMAALPAVEAAAEALNNIKKNDLQELKAFKNPPIHVKVVCSMCAMLRPTGEKLDDSWADSKKMLGNPKLLDLLKAYPKDDMTEKMAKSTQKILNQNKKYDITVDNMATKSKAGKGLLVWVFAIMKYYEVAKDVEPLRNKVRKMEKAQANTESELAQLKELLAELNGEISELEVGYSKANNELSDLQTQAEEMERRLTAASKLIEGLTGERQRWSNDVNALLAGRTTLVGNAVCAASFLSYMGAFNTEYRQDLLQTLLLSDLSERSIPFSEGFKVNDMLTTEAEVQVWNANGLPMDEHSVQNGILTNSGSRFPLCIDPQQQAVSWIRRTYTGKQLTVKTMNDSDFVKHLELAVQYGNPFLLENIGEDIDPILNPILDKDVTIQSGGRRTISMGDKVIDWDENFRLFFCTKLSNPAYSPEVMGKVTLINYSVTRDGLSDQLLNVVVSHERPDLEKQFKELVETMAANSKLLVTLEDSLLRELSSSTGNILDNEDLISTLENTKQKASEIRDRLVSAEATKAEINTARSSYRPVACRGSTLYFSSAGMSTIMKMYELSLDAFLGQFVKALDQATAADDLDSRLAHLIKSCTNVVFDFTCIGLFERHKLTYVFHLACMILEEAGALDKTSLSLFLKGDTSVGLPSEQKPDHIKWLGDNGWKDLLHLAQSCDSFAQVKDALLEDSTAFKDWYDTEAPEECDFPVQACNNLSAMQKLCVVRVLRPDRCFNAARLFVATSMGERFLQPPLVDYQRVFEQSSSLSPTIFILSPGADPQADIQNLASELGFELKFVSLGQGQGPVAMQTLAEGARSGHWVLLQNCHLLISWLKELDKKLEQMKDPNKNFRLWLTTEPTDRFPLSILQRSFRIVTEPPDGLKLNMRGTMAKIDQSLLDECPHPRFKPLVFALAYLHAIVQERRKYGKLGWNVSYDFNESDSSISRKLMSLYLTKAWEDQDAMPWGSLKYLIGDAMYGGRVSDDMDRRVLTTYLNEFFGDFNFDKNLPFSFSRDDFNYTIPRVEDGAVEGYRKYVEELPLSCGPAVFGLHPNAEVGYYMQRTNSLWSALVSLQPRTSESGAASSREELVDEVATSVLEQIPILKPDQPDLGSFDVNIVRADLIKLNGGEQPTPCQIVLLQEIDRWNDLCKRMHSSLVLLKKACAGEIGMSALTDEISDSLFNGMLPRHWAQRAPPTEKKLGPWMLHFKQRYEQYSRWVEEGKEPNVIWLSGLHIPQSYLTALIQTTCRRKQWPLDKSSMYTVVSKYVSSEEISAEKGNVLTDGTYVSGLFLEGAAWDIGRSHLRRQDPKCLVVDLPLLQVVPVSGELKLQNTFRTPVYATSQRRNAAGAGLVFHADLASGGTHESIWTLQGVAITLEAD
mmetsp:Transcript_53278/g.159518  ORF Transcript_53278/g.159518 Transcript_53278/m.159518 type:complete len:3881 (-) Transcript_53278:473-12115(-)